jgi:hypothetical protein
MGCEFWRVCLFMEGCLLNPALRAVWDSVLLYWSYERVVKAGHGVCSSGYVQFFWMVSMTSIADCDVSIFWYYRFQLKRGI